MTRAWSRAVALCSAAALLTVTFLLMAHRGHATHGVLLGMGAILGASWLIAQQLNSPPDASRNAKLVEVDCAPLAVAGVVAGVGGVAAALFMAGRGVLSGWTAGVIVLLAYWGLLLAWVYVRRDGGGWRNPALWILGVVGAIQWPALGMASLIDPWESHYSEVAREMLSRDDWISTWWSWQGWFFSKPVLTFWLQALAMATLGVRWQPDQVLQGFHGAIARPEWIVRTPMALLSIVTVYLTLNRRGAMLLCGGGILAGCVVGVTYPPAIRALSGTAVIERALRDSFARVGSLGVDERVRAWAGLARDARFREPAAAYEWLAKGNSDRRLLIAGKEHLPL